VVQPVRPNAENADAPNRYTPEVLYRAAHLYYLEDATQAEIAVILGTSRPTVSRLLAEARATGIVRIEVRDPSLGSSAELARALERALGLRAAYVTTKSTGPQLGPVLAGSVSQALGAAAMRAGDALLVSSGATLHAIAQQSLPSLPGVLVVPTVGGIDEPAEYYQTNEITRTVGVKVHGTPVLLYAPLLPSAKLFRVLLEDESTRRVTSLWTHARVALLGIGAPRGPCERGRRHLRSPLRQRRASVDLSRQRPSRRHGPRRPRPNPAHHRRGGRGRQAPGHPRGNPGGMD